MNLKGIKKFYVGLGVIGIFTLAILIFVLSLASATKQDTNTYNTANDIATKLNDYIDKNQKIPDSLSQAGANNVPSTITYTKNSESSYTFCATYRQASSNFSSDGIDALTGSGLLQQTQSIDPGGVYTPTDNSYLYIDSNYHKGQNCQTIKPSIVSQTCGIDYYNNCSTSLPNPITTTSPPTTASSTDAEKQADVAQVDALINDYIANNNGSLPDGYVLDNGTLTIGASSNATSSIQLQYYKTVGQFSLKNYAAGDKNTTTNNMVIELDAVCSTSGNEPSAGNSNSFVILYSDSNGYECLGV